jgi:hypothetical protein
VRPPFHGVKSYVAVHSVNGYFTSNRADVAL